MQMKERVFVDDPAVFALIAELAAQSGCSEEEAIGLAVSAELARKGVDSALMQDNEPQ